MVTGRWICWALGLLVLCGAVSGADREGIDCEKAGTYSGLKKIASPELIQYYDISAKSYNSPGGNYHVTIAVQSMAPFPGVRVMMNISNGGTRANIFANVLQASWGFSPDDHRFIFLSRDLGSVHHMILYDLEKPAGSNEYHLFQSTSVSSMSSGFSPSGRYFAYAAESEAGYLSLKVFDVRDPDADFYYFSPSLGVDHAGWGFSPKNLADDDAAFFHAINGNAGIVCRLVNLQTMTSYPVGADTGTWWGFSPCGDVFGTVDGNAKAVRLYHTGTGQELPGGGWTGMAQDLKPRCDADNHYIGEDILFENTADKSCGGGGDDTEPPTWPDGASVTAENVSFKSLDLEWSAASDNEGVTQYRIYKDDEAAATLGADPRQYEATGLEMGTEYTFRVEAGDAANNWSSGGPSVTVSTLSDSAPTWPDGASLTARDVTETAVTLEWTAATDDNPLVGYRVYQYNYGSDILLGEVDGETTEIQLADLGAYEEYRFYVMAGDTMDQWTKGPRVTVRTLDETPPYWPLPKSLSAVSTEATSIELTWSDAEDNVGMYSYNLYVLKGGEWRLVARLGSKTLTVSCLTPGTSFHFKMEAMDYAWNESTDGPTAIISTSSGPADCSAVLERASVNSDGEETIGAHAPPTDWDPLGWDPHESEYGSISADGRYVAFKSIGINLVDDDNNTLYLIYGGGGWDAYWHSDVFVHDRQRGRTERVSVSSNEVEGNIEGSSGGAYISANGRYVAFSSTCSNLASPDTNGKRDIFLRDIERGLTFLISRSYLGGGANGHCWQPSVSNDGRLIAFSSSADNLVPGDENNKDDIFLYNRHTGKTRRVSVGSDGTEANGISWGTDISVDGRYIAFVSEARNLAAGATDYGSDVFVHDRITKETTHVSVSSEGADGNGRCCMETSYGSTKRWAARMSDEGRYVVFDSQANNLVEGDTNSRADSFVHDRLTGVTRRASVAGDGSQADEDCRRSDISGNGRFVVFDATATTLAAEQKSPWVRDVFVHDMVLGTTEKVSKCPCGTDGDDESGWARLNANGTAVVFDSHAKNLLVNLGDTNQDGDVFVLEREITAAVDLAVALAAVPVPARLGKRVVCTVAIKNLGPDEAEAVAMTFTAPAGLSITGVDAHEGIWQIDGTTVQYSADGLGWNERIDVTVDLLADSEGAFEVVAAVGSDVLEVEEGNGEGPDYDGQAGVTMGDFSVFSLDWMNAAAPFADLNGDGIVNFSDVALFSGSWLQDAE